MLNAFLYVIIYRGLKLLKMVQFLAHFVQYSMANLFRIPYTKFREDIQKISKIFAYFSGQSVD